MVKYNPIVMTNQTKLNNTLAFDSILTTELTDSDKMPA